MMAGGFSPRLGFVFAKRQKMGLVLLIEFSKIRWFPSFATAPKEQMSAGWDIQKLRMGI